MHVWIDRIASEDLGATRIYNLRAISAAGMEINPCANKGTTDTDELESFFASRVFQLRDIPHWNFYLIKRQK